MEQHNVSVEKKSSILKTLAIIGFIVILGLVAWLSVQLVQLFAPTVGSLASLAEGVNQYQESIIDTNGETLPLTVTSNTSLLNTGESLTINWSKVRAAGTYAFSYECVEGISISQVTELGNQMIDCATPHAVGETNSLTMVVESEKNRYADVPYSITFERPGGSDIKAAGGNVLTVVNTDVASQFAYNAPTEPAQPAAAPAPAPVVNVTQTPIDDTITEQPAITEPTLPTPPAAPLTFAIPTSDPNGYTDLATTFISMGEIINGAFVAGPVSIRNAGAVQFSVKNLGTKTSENWNYSIILPNGQTHTATNQRELKPNERAVITIGFPAGGNTPHTFVMIATEETDANTDNNSFRQTVAFAQ